MKYVPVLDKDFRPMYETFRNYLKEVNASEHKTLKVCVERNDGYNYVYEYPVYSSADKATENNKMAERIIKTILWVVGGYKIFHQKFHKIYCKNLRNMLQSAKEKRIWTKKRFICIRFQTF